MKIEQFEVDASSQMNIATDCYDTYVSITNHGNDVNVDVRLKLEDYDNSFAYEMSAALPSGSTKELRFKVPESYLKMFSDTRYPVVVQLYEKNKMLQETKLQCAKVFPDSLENALTVGLLADDPGKLYWMDNGGDEIYLGSNLQAIALRDLDRDFVEEDLAYLKVLVIDDFDTSVLSDEQIRMIESWVVNGGQLLIGTGLRPETLAGFDEKMLDAKVIEPGTEQMDFAYIDYGSSYVDPNGDGAYMTRQHMDGDIMILPYSLSHLEVSDVDGRMMVESSFGGEERNYFLHTVYMNLYTYSNSASAYNSSTSYYDIQECFNYIEPQVNLSFGWLRLLVLVYVVLIGPILYLLLKKANRREQIWFCIPVVAAVFVTLIFLAGAGNRVSGLHVSVVNVASADGGDNVRSHIEGYHSANRDWSMPLKESVYAAAPGQDRSYSFKESGSKIRVGGEKLIVDIVPGSSFDEFFIETLSKNTQKGSLRFTREGSVLNMGNVKGTLTNETGHDLAYALVIQNGFGVLFRDIKNGETFNTKDLDHVEEKDFMIDDYGVIRSYMTTHYDNKKYDNARMLGALCVGYMDLTNRGFTDGVIAVTEDDIEVVDTSAKREENLTVLYSKR
ncbi:MAG: hypothetical protein IK078_00745 [Lachnospiraceae bacterium]|nr:hypothetical protein [Lachnospiraceae bacterium]